MTTAWIRWVLGLMALAASGTAAAAISCSVSSPGWSTAYVPTAGLANITQTQVTVTCQRNLAGDGTSVGYDIQVNNGVQPTGNANRARLGATANHINYENYRDSGCGAIWKQNPPLRISGTISNLSGFLPTSQVTNYWGCVPAGQGATTPGSYTDLVTMTLTYGASTATNTFPVSIYSPATCNVTAASTPVVFDYASFSPAAVNATAGTIGITCSNLLPYTLAIDSTTNVIQGLRYTLSVRSTPTAMGAGAQKTHFIDGVMDAGQAGDCTGGACVTTQTRVLTITY